jgi:hypothetical protein
VAATLRRRLDQLRSRPQPEIEIAGFQPSIPWIAPTCASKDNKSPPGRDNQKDTIRKISEVSVTDSLGRSNGGLFAGTAWHYARYRPGYPQAFFDDLARQFRLDGTGRLLEPTSRM